MKWGGGGASGSPCSESFYGPSPFSAPETHNMAQYLEKQAPYVVSYIDFHAYSQLWMYPYGADCELEANPIIDEGGKVAAKALKKINGKSFAVGSRDRSRQRSPASDT